MYSKHYDVYSKYCDVYSLETSLENDIKVSNFSKFGWQLLNFLATLEQLLGVLSSNFCWIYEHNLFMPIWEPWRKLIAHQCCDQLTAVKTRYPLTSITWPCGGLRCRPIEVEHFLKLFANKLLVFKWSQAQFYFFKNSF